MAPLSAKTFRPPARLFWAAAALFLAACPAAPLLAAPAAAETQQRFYPSHQIKSRFQVRPDGKGGFLRHGFFLRFHPNGLLALRGRYSDDLPVGIWSWWDEKGVLLRRVQRDGRFEELLNGAELERPTTVFRDVVGIPVAEGLLKNNKGHGKWVYWYRDGTLKAEGTFLTGIPDGQWITFFPNGQIEKLVEYRLGIPNGFFLAGHATGEEAERGTMNQGLREGEWRFSHDNGQHAAQGRFLQDLREGEWKFWDRKGELVRWVVFHRGQVVREIPIPREQQPLEVVPHPERYVDRPRVFDDNGAEIRFRFPGELREGEEATTAEDVFEKPWERLRR